MAATDIQWDIVPQQFWGDAARTADFICLRGIKGVNAGLCSLRDARHMAWSQFVIAMRIDPQISAKEFYKVFDSMWKVNEGLKKKPVPKPVRVPSVPPILMAPPELAAEVLGSGMGGVPPTPAAKPARTKTPAQLTIPKKYRLDREGITATEADRRARQLYELTTYKFIKIVKTTKGYAVYKTGVGEAMKEWTGAPRRYIDYPDKSMANWGIMYLRGMGCDAHTKQEGDRWVVYKGACNMSAQTKKQPKKTAAAKTKKTTKKTAKPKPKKTAAGTKLTPAQQEYMAIQGFVMVKRGGKYVRITN